MFLLALAVAGIMVFRITTGKGTLIIESDDPNVEVVVKQGGKQVRIVDLKTKQEIELNSGEYEFQLAKAPDGLSLSTDRLTLKRGKTEIVRVRREVSVPTKADTGVAGTKPPGRVDENQDEAAWQLEQTRRADFDGFMAQGREHVAAKRYAEAIRAYNEALKLMPGDSTATTAVQDATRARAAQIQDATRARAARLAENTKLPEVVKSITNSIGMKLVLIPAGSFMMGGLPEEGGYHQNNEEQHEVEITQPFYMGMYTVTQAEYQRVMGNNPSFFFCDRCRQGQGARHRH